MRIIGNSFPNDSTSFLWCERRGSKGKDLDLQNPSWALIRCSKGNYFRTLDQTKQNPKAKVKFFLIHSSGKVVVIVGMAKTTSRICDFSKSIVLVRPSWPALSCTCSYCCASSTLRSLEQMWRSSKLPLACLIILGNLGTEIGTGALQASTTGSLVWRDVFLWAISLRILARTKRKPPGQVNLLSWDNNTVYLHEDLKG